MKQASNFSDQSQHTMIHPSYSKFNQSMNISLVWFILSWWWWWWWYRKNTLNHNFV